jgi:hypothetical protein
MHGGGVVFFYINLSMINCNGDGKNKTDCSFFIDSNFSIPPSHWVMIVKK